MKQIYYLQRGSKGRQTPRIHYEPVSQGSASPPVWWSLVCLCPTCTTAEGPCSESTLGLYPEQQDVQGQSSEEPRVSLGPGTELGLFHASPLPRMLFPSLSSLFLRTTSEKGKTGSGQVHQGNSPAHPSFHRTDFPPSYP